MSFTPDQVAYVDTYPPINIARVGDSSEYFIGTEIPGVEPVPEGGFKDKDQKIKKQAARFRVYAFDKDSKPLGEVTSKDYLLTWTCHVANKKAAWVIFRGKYRKETWQLRNKTVQGWPEGQPPNYDYTNTRTKLIIDSGEQTIEGENAQSVALQGEFQGSLDKAIPVQLGELRTDEHGRLLVLASDGDSFSAIPPAHQDLHSGFDNDGWVDKMCDGSVRVTVKSKSQPELKITVKNRATILTAPPRFASGTHIPTTLYELIEDIYEQSRRGKGYDVGEVVYYRDIYPLFRRIYLLSWTNQFAFDGHGASNMDYFDNPDLSDSQANNKARRRIFQKMRLYVVDGDADNERIRDGQANDKFMPRLAGDDGDCQPGVRDRWASLTRLQYERMQKWSEGNFTTGQPEVPYESFDKIPLAQQPDALTRSAIEWSIGAPLYPGIECFWIAQASKMYNLREKFRFSDIVTPGDLGKGLSLPWQSDFNMCNTHWWPSVRPDVVVTEEYFQQVKSTSLPDQLASSLKKRFPWDQGLNTNSDMVRKWNKLGFVAREKYETSPDQLEILIERQRDLPRS